MALSSFILVALHCCFIDFLRKADDQLIKSGMDDFCQRRVVEEDIDEFLFEQKAVDAALLVLLDIFVSHLLHNFDN